MDRWGKRSNVKEVKLIRLSPNDYRMGEYGRKHKAGKAVVLLVAAAFILSVCFLGFYYVFDSKAKGGPLQTVGTVEGSMQGDDAPEGAAEEIAQGDDAPVGAVEGNMQGDDASGGSVEGSVQGNGTSETSVDEEMGSIGAFSEGRGLPGAWEICGLGSHDSQDLSGLPGGQDVPDGTDTPGGQDAQDPSGESDSSDEPDSPPLVVIAPGYGEEGISEAWANLELAGRLSGKLKELGYDTLILQEDEEDGLTLEERVGKALEAGADLYIGIRGNVCKKGKSAEAGIGTWYYGESGEVRRLAKLVHKGAVEKTGASDKGVQEWEQLYADAFSDIPSCLIETAFWTGVEEGEDIGFQEYQEKLAKGMAWGINLYFNPRTMYLTFDDGPSQDNTTAVLDILKERGIKATFFLVGENVRKHPEVARRIVEEGHTVGIHCNRHVYEDLYQSVDSYLEDFQEAYDAVYEVTGVEVKLFRFPGGSINSYNKDVHEEIIEKMEENGFIYFDWNASLEDAARGTTPEKLIQNAVSSTFGRKKVVMLAHDIKSNTVQCLEELIDRLPEYKMEPLTPEVEPVHF